MRATHTARELEILRKIADSEDGAMHHLPGGHWTVRGEGMRGDSTVPRWFCSITELRELEKAGLVRPARNGFSPLWRRLRELTPEGKTFVRSMAPVSWAELANHYPGGPASGKTRLITLEPKETPTMIITQQHVETMKLTANALATQNDDRGGSNVHAANVYRRVIEWLSEPGALAVDTARALKFLEAKSNEDVGF